MFSLVMKILFCSWIQSPDSSFLPVLRAPLLDPCCLCRKPFCVCQLPALAHPILGIVGSSGLAWCGGQLWPGLVLQAAVAWPRLALRAALARHGVALWAVEAKPISVLSSCLLIRREERSSVLRWGLSYKCS